jgi:hypothetical protein
MSDYPSSMCRFCKHYHKKELPFRPFTCDAFPDAIPDNIFFHCGDHRKPVKGDHGIQFEKRQNLTADDKKYFKYVYETTR